jgi:hypothetical protein
VAGTETNCEKVEVPTVGHFTTTDQPKSTDSVAERNELDALRAEVAELRRDIDEGFAVVETILTAMKGAAAVLSLPFAPVVESPSSVR